MPHTSEERSLNADEARVLDQLLSLDFPGASELRLQQAHARVVGRCQCGCATVDLAVDISSAPPAQGVRSPIPAEAEVVGEGEQPPGGVIVFLKDGYLSGLEIYSYGEPIRAWPAAGSLRPYVRGA
jgi:hypothetical protein